MQDVWSWPSKLWAFHSAEAAEVLVQLWFSVVDLSCAPDATAERAADGGDGNGCLWLAASGCCYSEPRGRQRRQLGIPFALSAQRTPGLAAPRRVAFKKGRKIATEVTASYSRSEGPEEGEEAAEEGEEAAQV